MAPQRRDDDDDFDLPESTTQEEVRSTPTVKYFPGKHYSMATSTVTDITAQVTGLDYDGRTRFSKFPPFSGRPYLPTGGGSFDPWDAFGPTSTFITTTKAIGGWQSQWLSEITSEPHRLETDSSPPASSIAHGKGPPPWSESPKGKDFNGGMYAAAAITPVVVLAMIGGLVFFCMRKRKRRPQAAAAGQLKTQEMKMQPHPQPSAQPYYMAPPAAASPQYSVPSGHLQPPANPAVPQPIILGPIPSGTNGAYFTGIDTSDVVSITSASNPRPSPPNPFSDNDSLAEPPPPYRPRSAAPPSLTNSSRHSSFRVAPAPPATSTTHLIERSPFDDPVDDEDTVSDLSGPTRGHNEDEMSAVSDLSYQHDPVVNRPAL